MKISKKDLNTTFSQCVQLSLCNYTKLGWLESNGRFLLSLVLGAIFLLLSTISTKAATITWTGTTGDWSNSANWGGIEPTIADDASIANGGSAILSQAGEVCHSLYLGGSGPGQSGTLQMNSGDLSIGYVYIGNRGIGVINQSAGSVTVSNSLVLGLSGNGTYILGGASRLSAPTEAIGSGANGVFQQTGGTNTTSFLNIGAKGQYQFSGGDLEIQGSFKNSGIMDFTNNEGVMNCSDSIIDFSQPGAILRNTQSATLNVAGNSLLIVPVGFDPLNAFAHYHNQGILHTLGTTLTVAAGQSIVGSGTIADRVECQGTIHAISGGSITLNNGLMLSGLGNVDLGQTGSLRVEDTTSGIDSGALSLSSQYVGFSGTGSFTHSGGISTLSTSLNVGYNAGSNGTYNLSSSGRLNSWYEYVGNSGTGNFVNSGGVNAISGPLSIGLNSGSSGIYTLINGGQLSSATQYVGYSGAGIVVQSSGTNTIADALYLGYKSNSTGTYNLSSGQIISAQQHIGYSGVGTFNQTGGNNSISGALYIYANGNYNLSGTSSILTSMDQYVGYTGTTASFTQSSGINSINKSLYLGSDPGTSGTYTLSDSGQLIAGSEFIGKTIAGSTNAYGLFQQSGGNNTTSSLTINGGSKYMLTGGTLQVNGRFENLGVLDLAGGEGVMQFNNTIVNFAQAGGAPKNSGAGTLNLSGNSLLIVPVGYDPKMAFAQYGNEGMLHTVGTVLSVGGGQTIQGSGTISDHVDCQGAILAPVGGAISLTNGLMVSNGGNAELGNGSVVIADASSGVAGGTLSCSSMTIGMLSSGAFTHSAGVCTIGNLQVRFSSIGTYNLSGTAQLVCGSETVDGGGGTFSQSGGLNTTSNLFVSGHYELSGGTLQVNGRFDNKGIFDFAGGNGTLSCANTFVDFTQTGGVPKNSQTATLRLAGNSILIVPQGYDPATSFAHYSNEGILHVMGTPLVVSNTQSITGVGKIIDHVYCQGSITAISGSGIQLYGGVSVSGSGRIVLQGGDLRVNDAISGIDSGFLSVNSLSMGSQSTAVFSQTGGQTTVSTELYVGYQYPCTYSLSGSSQLSSRNLYVGYYKTGAFAQSGGTNDVLSNVYVGYSNGSSASTYDLTGASSLACKNEYIGYGGVGIFTQSGGINTISGTLLLGNSSGSNATYNLAAGTLFVNAISKGAGTAAFNFGGATLRAGATFDTSLSIKLTGSGGNSIIDSNGFAVGISGVLSGPGGLTKLGSNTLTLGGKNTYTGPTTIKEGVLALGGTATIASGTISVEQGAILDVSTLNEEYTLQAGQTLTGTGKIVGNISINGIHAPGNSPGIEMVQGIYNMLGQLQIELEGTTAGAGYDQVLLPLNGSTNYITTLGGTLLLDWGGMNGSTDSTQLWILRNDSSGTLSGTFSNYSNGASLGNHDGHEWYLWYGADAATGNLTGGNDVVITPIPEPSTLALLLFATLGGLFWWRRKR